jgi:hypothetical protein
MAKKKFVKPKSERIKFEGPIKQDGWNKSKSVDSISIHEFQYNPEKEEMRIIFNTSKYRRYTYQNVPVSAAQRVADAVQPRRLTLPERADSLGATFVNTIKAGGYNYIRRWVDSGSKKK